jgi:hypothetical protein
MVQGGSRTLAPLAPGISPVDIRQHDVFEDGAMCDEMEGLEDESDPASAQSRTPGIAQPGDIHPVKSVSARGRDIEQAHNVEQGGFSGTGRAGDCQPLALPHVKVHADQGIERRICPEAPADATQRDDGRLRLK